MTARDSEVRAWTTDGGDGIKPLWVVEGQRPPTSRGQRTRSKLVSAAESLFRERYFRDVTLSDIATASGLSVGTFYSYFETKEDIFIEIVSRVFVEMYQQARGGWRRGLDIRENIRSTTRSYIGSYYRNRQIMRSAYHLAATNERAKDLLWAWQLDLEGQMLKRLKQDQASSSLEPLESVRLIRALSSMVDEYVRRVYAEEEFGTVAENDLDAASEVLAGVWFRAIFGSTEPQSAAPGLLADEP